MVNFMRIRITHFKAKKGLLIPSETGSHTTVKKGPELDANVEVKFCPCSKVHSLSHSTRVNQVQTDL